MLTRPPRTAVATWIAALANAASGCSLAGAPSRRREYRSSTVARYSLPSSVGISVMSPHQRQFGAGAVKSRPSRSGNFGAFRSCFVVLEGRFFFRPTKPWRRIESATVFTDTDHPASTRSAWIRGEPYVRFEPTNMLCTNASSFDLRS